MCLEAVETTLWSYKRWICIPFISMRNFAMEGSNAVCRADSCDAFPLYVIDNLEL